MIPKIISFVWIGPHSLPDWANENIQLFHRLNPDYRTQIVGEEVLMPCFERAYKRIEGEHEWARKSDILRICILLRTGGWYFDCDHIPFQSIDAIHDKYNIKGTFITHAAYLQRRPWITNAIIGTKHDSPFLSLVATSILMRAEKHQPLSWGAYGPCIFTQLSESHPELITMGKLDDFHRVQDRSRIKRIYSRIKRSNYRETVICRELGRPKPFMLHMMMQDEVTL